MCRLRRSESTDGIRGEPGIMTITRRRLLVWLSSVSLAIVLAFLFLVLSGRILPAGIEEGASPPVAGHGQVTERQSTDDTHTEPRVEYLHPPDRGSGRDVSSSMQGS